MGAHVGLADRIRTFALEFLVKPALRSGEVNIRIRAGDVHRDLGLQNRMPAVCSALESNKFRSMSGLTLVGRQGPYRGANAVYFFEMRTDGGAQVPHPALATESRKTAPPAIRLRSPQNGGTEIWVSCVSRKRQNPSAAKDLYLSDWFVKARAYAESTGRPWQILSAKHGLVSPGELIAPYDLTLNTLPVAARRAWASRVVDQIHGRKAVPGQVILLAGARYREFLVPRLEELGICVEVPMSGLRIGEQLSWLKNAVNHG